MPYRVYPMDTCFYNSITRYPFEVRLAGMAAELGYDATYLTCWSEQAWKDVAKLPVVKKTYGLDVAAAYVTVDLAGGDELEENRKAVRLIESIEGCPNVEIAIKTTVAGMRPSDPIGDEVAIRFLERLLPICEKRGITLLLYSHINFWMEGIGDAIRLCQRLDHPHLGAMFCGFHWYAVDGKMLVDSLTNAGKHLKQVNLCGSRRDPNGLGGKATIEPLDDGEMDNFAIMGQLQRLGFAGYVGFQGYSSGGDPYAKLRRSLAAFRDIEARLARHPNWAVIP